MGLVETTPLPLPVDTSTVAILEASRDWMLETWSEVGSLDLVMLRLARDLSRTTLKPVRVSLALLPPYASLDGLHVVWSSATPERIIMLTRPHGFLEQPEHLYSPLHEVHTTNQALRIRLATDPPRFQFLAELAARGATDYLALPLATRHSARPVLTVATNQPGGWSEADIADLKRIAPALSLIVEVSEVRRLLELASTDALTGLANRRSFDLAFRQAWATCSRADLPLSLLYFDVDHFKAYNDTYGHIAGDRCLAQIAATAMGVVKRGSDVVARIGGEEFALLLPTCNEEGARQIGERVRAKIEALAIAHVTSGVSDRVTVSVGGVMATANLRTDRLLLPALADEALYGAKTGGRNRVLITAMNQP